MSAPSGSAPLSRESCCFIEGASGRCDGELWAVVAVMTRIHWRTINTRILALYAPKPMGDSRETRDHPRPGRSEKPLSGFA